MFDFEEEDTRDELELMEAQEQEENEAKSEHEVDFRPPADIIEEFMQTLVLLVERQPAASAKVLRLMTDLLSASRAGVAAEAASLCRLLLKAAAPSSSERSARREST